MFVSSRCGKVGSKYQIRCTNVVVQKFAAKGAA
jgi:hypothetical protein